MNYSYDPTKIKDRGKNQMRFETGDTLVDGGSDTCALSDEEYEGLLADVENGGMAWKKAKLYVLEAILHKMSFQVNVKIDVLQYDFGGRTEMWKKLYDDLKSEITGAKSVPSMSADAVCKPPYFYSGMGRNPMTGDRRRYVR